MGWRIPTSWIDWAIAARASGSNSFRGCRGLGGIAARGISTRPSDWAAPGSREANPRPSPPRFIGSLDQTKWTYRPRPPVRGEGSPDLSFCPEDHLERPRPALQIGRAGRPQRP